MPVPKQSSLRILVVAVAGLVGCGSTGASEPEASDALIGTYHLPDMLDAHNLVMSDLGVFKMSSFGCDYSRGSAGIWASHGQGAVRLSPRMNKSFFEWLDDKGGFLTLVTSVDLEVTDGGIMAQIATDEPVVGNNPQFWASGRKCLNGCTAADPAFLEPCPP